MVGEVGKDSQRGGEREREREEERGRKREGGEEQEWRGKGERKEREKGEREVGIEREKGERERRGREREDRDRHRDRDTEAETDRHTERTNQQKNLTGEGLSITRPTRLSRLSSSSVMLYVHRNHKDYKGPGRPPLLLHSS